MQGLGTVFQAMSFLCQQRLLNARRMLTCKVAELPVRRPDVQHVTSGCASDCPNTNTTTAPDLIQIPVCSPALRINS